MNQIGQFRGIKQCEMKCYSTPECNATCLHEGYEEGKCLKSWDGGVECCCLGLLASSHQDSSPISSPHYIIFHGICILNIWIQKYIFKYYDRQYLIQVLH